MTPALCLLLSGCGGGGGGTATNGAGHAAAPFVLPSEERILPSSLELERKTQPWCPGDCDVAVPFVASYQHGAERLVFVGVRHAFQSNDPTMLAVAAGFSEIHPGIVIVEGFPTAMGENPAPLVAEARRYGAPDASEFDRGEAMYAAALALKKGIPFVGGEPSQEEEMQVLNAKSFTDSDIGFDALLGGFSQALRSGDIPDTSLASLEKVYPQLAKEIRAPTDLGGWNLAAPSLDDFRERYRGQYGIDIEKDSRFILRIDAGDSTRHGQQSAVNMLTRDRHLLGLIEQQLADKHSVLVVYGASHWSTLSAALANRLRNPRVTPFFK